MAIKKRSSSRKSLRKTSANSYSSSRRREVTSKNIKVSKVSSHSVRTIRTYISLSLAILLILIGVGLIFWASVQNGFYISKPKTDQLAPVQSGQTVEERAKPAKLTISKLNRTLDISDGFVENNRWVVAKSGVSYLTTSGEIGTAGNAVIYGHNTQGILGGLWRVQNGDIVQVSDDRGRVYKYEIFERKEIKPTQVEILNQTDDSRLTIYTCSGFLDTARFVVVGKLI